jgi:hypothetical protein
MELGLSIPVSASFWGMCPHNCSAPIPKNTFANIEKLANVGKITFFKLKNHRKCSAISFWAMVNLKTFPTSPILAGKAKLGLPNSEAS